VRVSPTDNLRSATQTLLANKLRRIPVTDTDGRVVGMLDEADVSRYYLEATGRTPPPIAVDPPVAAS
jgi:CIC family chloride channel protein